MQQKRCTKCYELKDIAEFYEARRGKYGVEAQCKKCKSAYFRQHRQHPEVRARERERLQKYYRQSRKIILEKSRQYYYSERGQAYFKAYRQSAACKESRRRYDASEKGQARSKKANKKQIRKFPERKRARSALSNAICDGKMLPAKDFQCVHCGKPARQHHHHNGYDREHWLDVIPLCILCHTIEHQKNSY